MAKEINIPQGIYEVGVDFLEGSYIFATNNIKTHITIEDSDDYTSFNLDDENGYEARIALKKGVTLTLHTKMQVSKAEPLNFN